MKYKKYKIEFIDPTGSTEWHTEEELQEFEPYVCVLEAYVFSKDKKFVRTFASYSNGEDGEITFGDVNVLPTATIKSMRRLK